MDRETVSVMRPFFDEKNACVPKKCLVQYGYRIAACPLLVGGDVHVKFRFR